MMNSREKGNYGEEIACDYLRDHGYLIQERNYYKKWGEIDIVAIKDGIIHFVEVKSVIHNGQERGYRPEENVHEMKIKKLRRIIQTYLNDRERDTEANFKFHVITVKTNQLSGKSDVEMLENIIL